MSSPATEPIQTPLTIVAAGASAGGLDPLKDFFRAVVPAPDVCYVVITHLPVAHISHLAELLGRVTAMPVGTAADREKLTGGQVYVVPPGILMGIRDGVFSIDALAPKQRPPKPIDYFMTELADDAPDHCIGVVLSGSDHASRGTGRCLVSARPTLISPQPGNV